MKRISPPTMKSRIITFLLVLLALLGTVNVPVSAGDLEKRYEAQTHLAAPEPEDTENISETLVERINLERARIHLNPLTEDARLSEAAAQHSRDMARNDFFSHRGFDGSMPEKRVRRQGYNWTYVSENVICGIEGSSEIVKKWMASREHRNNMLSPLAVHIGIGRGADHESKCAPYWTALFAAEK
jgi:uncharacterized protein YkwD